MKPLSQYNITTEDWVVYRSKICSVACSLEYPENSVLDVRINELVNSYLNQWQFVVTSYNKLYNLFLELNDKSDSSEKILTEYDIFSVIKESEFRDYTYLLIISLKTFLDLFACLTDIIITQEIKPEEKLPSFHSLGKSRDFACPQILQEFDNFRNKDLYPWIANLNEHRNKLVHRGYHLKPQFHFKKENELTILMFKGIDTYYKTSSIKVGELFANFMGDMPKIDEQISSVLLSSIEKLGKQIKVQVSYKFNGENTHFFYSVT